jgi:hypothetical protein
MRRVLGALVALSLFGFALTLQIPAYSQSQTEVQCGEIVEGVFSDNAQEHNYGLTMESRESFEVSVEPVGDHLQTVIAIYGPSGVRLGYTNVGAYGSHPSRNPAITSGTLSASGMYKIRISNTVIRDNNQLWYSESYNFTVGGIGDYTLFISCTLRNGQKVEAGNIPQPTPTPAPLPTTTPRSALPDTSSTFTGTGFPGLAPVDFADAVTVPLLLDEKMTGVIPLDNQILGFTLDAAAGDTLDLSYTRVSGNMNLGLVVLSAENEVFFQASLVTSASLATQFTLPAAGQYTIGVFRISLVEPAAVEPTVFQLRITTAD